jgi:hypothetical protein
MSDTVTNELIYKLMLEIQAEQKASRAGQEVIHAELTAVREGQNVLASSMVSMRKQMDDLTTGTRLIALSVDDHTHQLGAITTRLDGIEKKLDRTHA